MMGTLEVRGVYLVKAPEPCHLVEVIVQDAGAVLDFSKITQRCPGQPRSNWQVPWDERILNQSPDRIHAVFFFHYLDLDRPLLTPFGEVTLPAPTPMPRRLDHIEYEPP